MKNDYSDVYMVVRRETKMWWTVFSKMAEKQQRQEDKY